MGTLTAYTLYDGDMGDTASIGKNLILAKLLRDKVIDKDTYLKYGTLHTVIYIKPSRFSVLWKKLFKSDENRFILVRTDDFSEADIKSKE